MKVSLQLLVDAGKVFDQRKFENRLRVVGDRSVGVDRDRHRSHAQEPEGHQPEREDRRGDHQIAQPLQSNHVGNGHEASHGEPEVIG